MEPVLVIHNRNIPKMMIEYYSRATRWIRYGICGVFALIFLGTGIAGVLPQMAEEVILYAALYIPAAWFTPHLIVWLAMRKVKKENDGKIPEALVLVEEDAIRIREDMAEIVVQYSRIKKVEQLKHSYAIVAGATSVLLDTNGFSKGTLEEFKNFLQTKRPDLKVKKNKLGISNKELGAET